jgi:hypothetical protein
MRTLHVASTTKIYSDKILIKLHGSCKLPYAMWIGRSFFSPLRLFQRVSRKAESLTKLVNIRLRFKFIICDHRCQISQSNFFQSLPAILWQGPDLGYHYSNSSRPFFIQDSPAGAGYASDGATFVKLSLQSVGSVRE